MSNRARQAGYPLLSSRKAGLPEIVKRASGFPAEAKGGARTGLDLCREAAIEGQECQDGENTSQPRADPTQ